MATLGGWVTGFLCLLGLRRQLTRDRNPGPLAGTRLLGSLGDWLAVTPVALYGLIALAASVLITVAVRRHRTFQTGFDLGIFDQALWNTTHGRLLFSSLKGDTILLGDHFDPLQLVLVPFYQVVVPSPLIPLVAQGLVLALGAVPLYWLARASFPGSVLGPLFPLLYLLYRPLRNANRTDYHPTAFVPVLLLLAFHFMERRRWGPMVTFLVLAGLCKENMPAAGIAVGLYLVVTGRQRSLGIALSAGFAVWLAAGFLWVIPAFTTQGYMYYDRYQLGSGSWLVARKLVYLVHLFGPVAFLPILAPARLLLALPFLAQNLLSTTPQQSSIGSHYVLELVPVVFYAALGGAARLVAQSGVPRDRFAGYRGLAAVLLAASLFFHAKPEMWHLRQYRMTPHLARLAATVAAVPREAAVATQHVILPHLTHREFIYLFPGLGPGPIIRAEYVILDRRLDPWPAGPSFDDEIARLPARAIPSSASKTGSLSSDANPARAADRLPSPKAILGRTAIVKERGAAWSSCCCSHPGNARWNPEGFPEPRTCARSAPGVDGELGTDRRRVRSHGADRRGLEREAHELVEMR